MAQWYDVTDTSKLPQQCLGHGVHKPGNVAGDPPGNDSAVVTIDYSELYVPPMMGTTPS